MDKECEKQELNHLERMAEKNVQHGKGLRMEYTSHIEKFSAAELSDLREDLQQSYLDSWQAAEIVSSFLSGRGYGVNQNAVPDAVSRIERSGCNIECMQCELERVALVM